jgi:hypothetical protein
MVDSQWSMVRYPTGEVLWEGLVPETKKQAVVDAYRRFVQSSERGHRASRYFLKPLTRY